MVRPGKRQDLHSGEGCAFMVTAAGWSVTSCVLTSEVDLQPACCGQNVPAISKSAYLGLCLNFSHACGVDDYK